MEQTTCNESILAVVSRLLFLAQRIDADVVQTLQDARAAGCTVEALCEVTGWSRATLYRRIGQ